ncbi:DMP19 family protein [Histophilus somni]|uniref:DMP19 family protein n=1 Tax=Histophilus somni TaxID=731 RepID=UPI00201F2436|nr:DMP19 family protein [Histophilus somni]
MQTTKEAFKTLSNKGRLEVIQNLDWRCDRDKILELLLSVDISTLDSRLLSELGKVYNNSGKYEKAVSVLEMVAENERDAIWYYRYAYSHSELANESNYDFETEAKHALEKLEKAIKISNDEETIRWCLELVDFSDFEEILKKNKEKYPILTEKFFEYINQENEKIEETIETAQAQKKLKYAKFTVEDIKSLVENTSFVDCLVHLLEPMWTTINIYDGYEKYLQSAKSFTLEQRYLLAINRYFLEVNNGGHHQFFYNSTGIVWEDALNGFKHFGMNECATNFQKVIDYCGGTISFDREERKRMLEILEENEEEFYKFLDEADDFVYEYEGEENEVIYIKNHPEKFIFEGEYWAYDIRSYRA